MRVSVRKKRPRWLVFPLTLIIRLRLKTNIKLDRLGTNILDFCDGQKTVENIIDAFCNEYALTFHEGRVSVTKYLRELIHRGILVITA